MKKKLEFGKIPFNLLIIINLQKYKKLFLRSVSSIIMLVYVLFVMKYATVSLIVIIR